VLTLRTLNLVNSGAFALRREVDTVHQAVVLLGVREVTVLVSTLLVDARPDAMDSLWFILARSLTCEILADDPAGYTVGMLSALAGQLGVPPEVILDKVGVSQAVRDAVAEETGPLGSVLAAVRAHERRDPGAVLEAGLLPAEVSSAYVRCVADALATARTVTRGPDF
jgi:EAL and modified HD-GYP domain-containing signal transduction protein